MGPILMVDPGWGVTVIRLTVGVILVRMGWMKWMVVGMSEVAAAMTQYGLPAPALWAYVVGTTELLGGLALLAGVFTRWVGLVYAAQAVVTLGIRLRFEAPVLVQFDMLLIAAGVLFFLSGPGRLAVDEHWRLDATAGPRI